MCVFDWLGAIEKSARAAGLSSTIAENYAQQIAHKLPSKYLEIMNYNNYTINRRLFRSNMDAFECLTP